MKGCLVNDYYKSIFFFSLGILMVGEAFLCLLSSVLCLLAWKEMLQQILQYCKASLQVKTKITQAPCGVSK